MKSKESIPRRSTCVIGEECVGILLSVQCESIVIRGGTAGYNTCPCRRTGVFCYFTLRLHGYPGGLTNGISVFSCEEEHYETTNFGRITT